MNKQHLTNPFILLSAVLTILITVIYPNTGFCNPEGIFKAALNYTVKIRTTVGLPFSGDEKGIVKGAGFIVDNNRGWILTNAHVVSRSPSLNEVAFRNTEYFRANKVYVDPYLDLAILKVQPSLLPKNASSASLACNSPVPTGHAVGAFGHPYNLSYTGTRGIISGRTFDYGPEFIQTDTPINEGNSGGPLVSLVTGQVIGINTAKINGENSEGLNFAIPIEQTCKILKLLRLDKDPSPPQLPIMFIKNRNKQEPLKVAVSYLTNSDLDLREGDVIEEVVGYSGEINNESTLVHALRGHLSDVRLKVRRNNETLIVEGNLKPAELVTERKAIFVSGLLIGARSFKKDASEVDSYKLLRIHHVDVSSVGASNEIESGDILQSIDGHPIQDLDVLHKYLETASQEQRNVKLLMKRVVGDIGAIFEYRECTLPIKDLKLVGGKKTD